MATPRHPGCVIFTTVTLGARRYGLKPFADFVYDSTSISTAAPTAGLVPFFDNIREIAVRRLIIHSVATATATNVSFEAPGNVAKHTIPFGSADMVPGKVIEFPNGGLRFPHPVALNKNNGNSVLSIVYDIIN